MGVGMQLLKHKVNTIVCGDWSTEGEHARALKWLAYCARCRSSFIQKAEAFLDSIRTKTEPLEREMLSTSHRHRSVFVDCLARIRRQPTPFWIQLRCLEHPPQVVREVMLCTVALIAEVCPQPIIRIHQLQSDSSYAWRWATRLLSSPQSFLDTIETFTSDIDGFLDEEAAQLVESVYASDNSKMLYPENVNKVCRACVCLEPLRPRVP